MSYQDRRVLCADLEQYRQRALIVYVTSYLGEISPSALPEFFDQIHRVPPDATRLDLLVVSDGGDGDLAWQVMPILRERFQEVAVLVPAHAFSAATLLALGADRIVMHPSGRLGPVDPQFRKDPYPADAGGRQRRQWFNYDELQNFLKFLAEHANITDPPVGLLEQYFEEVGASTVGHVAAVWQNNLRQAQELLEMHMNAAEANRIANELYTGFHNHGHAITRKAARQLGLPIADSDPLAEGLMWKIWLDVESELEMRKPFIPERVVAESEQGKRLFSATCQRASAPDADAKGGGVDPEHQFIEIEPVPYRLSLAVIESRTLARRHIAEGRILATRSAKPELKTEICELRNEWETVFDALDVSRSPKQDT